MAIRPYRCTPFSFAPTERPYEAPRMALKLSPTTSLFGCNESSVHCRGLLEIYSKARPRLEPQRIIGKERKVIGHRSDAALSHNHDTAQWGPALAGAPTFGHPETDGTERSHARQLKALRPSAGIIHPLQSGRMGHWLKPAPTESNGSFERCSNGRHYEVVGRVCSSSEGRCCAASARL